MDDINMLTAVEDVITTAAFAVQQSRDESLTRLSDDNEISITGVGNFADACKLNRYSRISCR